MAGAVAVGGRAPLAPLTAGSGIWSQSSTIVAAVLVEQRRPLRRRASRRRWVGVVGCSMMRMSESRAGNGDDSGLAGRAEVAVEELEMVGHGVGVGGVGPGDDAAGVAWRVTRGPLRWRCTALSACRPRSMPTTELGAFGMSIPF